jgi:hypothetical protein
MKRNFLIITILSLVVFACGPVATTDTAIDYNDEMMDIQTGVNQGLVDLLDEIEMGDENDILDAKAEAIKVIEDAEKNVKEMDDFDDKDDYKKAMLKLIDMYKDVVENGFAEVIDYTIYFDELTDEEEEYYHELYSSALEKYDVAMDEFSEFQEGYAEEWDFVIE